MNYLAPAKINLNLLVESRDEGGHHPLRSLVQTLEWCDRLSLVRGDSDDLDVNGADVPDDDSNLVLRAVREFRKLAPVPPLSMSLEKNVPVAAGLGGGSADAAAALVACCEVTGQPRSRAFEVAPAIGADVSVLIDGGTAEMSGYGERVEKLPALDGFALAIVVPDFELSTAAVYRRWDEIGEPVGFEVPERFLPPVLRGLPIRNDLHRAAVDLEPALGDFIRDVSSTWDGVALLTGSGPACFGFFATADEAAEAANSIPSTRASVGVELRSVGVEKVASEEDEPWTRS